MNAKDFKESHRMVMRFLIFSISVCKFWKFSDANYTMANVENHCPLLCKNGASCHRLKNDNLQHLIALGETVDSCGPCPDGFVGIACDIPLGCIVAHQHSEFAGLMCQNPITEYCLHDGSQYCTNGGKCSKFFLHEKFPDDQLCACPLEFEGPHCEWLKSKEHLVDASYLSRANNSVSDAMATSTFILLSLSLVTIAIVLFLQERRKRRLLHRDVDEFGEEAMWDEVSLRIASSRAEEPFNFRPHIENEKEKENDSFIYT